MPTAVSTAVPVRSTTALVEELWELEEPLGEFPPPAAPAIAATPGRWGWLRVLVTILFLGAIGVGAHLGTTMLLDAHTDGIVDDAQASVAQVRDTASRVGAAAATIADPAADDVALSTATGVVTALEEDARALRSIAEPEPGWPDAIGIRLVDPIAGWRSAASVIADRSAGLADQLSEALTTRLLVDRIPALPELPSGADDATIDELEGVLTSTIAGLRSDLPRYDPALAERLAPVVDGWEETSTAYVGALRSHAPDAEAYAGEVTAARDVVTSVVADWMDGLGERLGTLADAYESSIASVG